MKRIRIGLGLVAVVVLALGGWLSLRDSSLVAVCGIEVTGATASDGDRVRAALERAAHTMTTLHVREDALRGATAVFPSVGGLKVRTGFPHRLTIQVLERRAVAALAPAGDVRLPVSASGVVL